MTREVVGRHTRPFGAPPLADELFTNVLRSFNDAIEYTELACSKT